MELSGLLLAFLALFCFMGRARRRLRVETKNGILAFDLNDGEDLSRGFAHSPRNLIKP